MLPLLSIDDVSQGWDNFDPGILIRVQRADLLLMAILAGQLLVADAPTHQSRLVRGFVRIEEERIVEVGFGDAPKSADFDNSSAVISPGFMDAHLHLPQFSIIGAHGLPLLRWLNEVTFPAEESWKDTSLARRSTQKALMQCLAHGTTSFCAYATVHHSSAIAALEVASEMGFRGAIGQVLMDREAPAVLCREANQLIDEAGKTLDRFPPHGEMSAAVTPRFAISCSEPLLRMAGELAEQRLCFIQSHLAETKEECERVDDLFHHISYVDVYRNANLLTRRTILGHGIHLTSDSLHTLAEYDSIIAHCPTANSFLGSGTMNRSHAEEHSVRVVLGSDIGAGFELSMIRVARAAIDAASKWRRKSSNDRDRKQDSDRGSRSVDREASKLWYDITEGAADALGWSDVGRIQVGSRADLLIIEPDIDFLSGPVDPLSKLLYAWNDRWIKRTYLRGKNFTWMH